MSNYKTTIVSVCALALVSGCVTEQKYDKEVQAYGQSQQQVAALSAQTRAEQELNAKLQTELSADQAQIKKLQNELKVTLVDQLVYPEGGWEIHTKGRETLDKIVPALNGATGNRIVVQGYTDSLPIGPELRGRFPTNWDLSAGRAAAVVRHLQEKGVDPARLEAAGFSQYQPVASNDTPQGRSKNRRIVIVLVPMP